MSELEDNMNISLGEKVIPKKGKLVPESLVYLDYTDDTSTESVPIPGGYCVVKDATVNGEEKKNSIATGLVISDVKDDDLNNTKKGNQFVWVPVNGQELEWMYDSDNQAAKLWKFPGQNGNSSNEPQKWEYDKAVYHEPDILDYEDLSILELSKADFETQLKKEFNEMIKSVKEYKGFYIGRYVTGNLKKDKENTPVVQKDREDISNINWYYMYITSKKIAKNSNVITNMIYGCQWDRTMEWIVDTNRNADGSKNYDMIGSSTGWNNSGSSEKNSIYDLVKCEQWTMEALGGHYRTYRGDNLEASSRGAVSPKDYSADRGSRATLYIKANNK